MRNPFRWMGYKTLHDQTMIIEIFTEFYSIIENLLGYRMCTQEGNHHIHLLASFHFVGDLQLLQLAFVIQSVAFGRRRGA